MNFSDRFSETNPILVCWVVGGVTTFPYRRHLSFDTHLLHLFARLVPVAGILSTSLYGNRGTL